MHNLEQPQGTLPTPQPAPYQPAPIPSNGPAPAFAPATPGQNPQPVIPQAHTAPQPAPGYAPAQAPQFGQQPVHHMPQPQRPHHAAQLHHAAPQPQPQTQYMPQAQPTYAQPPQGQMHPQAAGPMDRAQPVHHSGLPPMPGLAPISAAHVPNMQPAAPEKLSGPNLLKGLLNRSHKPERPPEDLPLLKQEIVANPATPRSMRSVFLTGLLAGLVLSFVASVAISKLGGGDATPAPMASQMSNQADAMSAAKAAMTRPPEMTLAEQTEKPAFIDQAINTP